MSENQASPTSSDSRLINATGSHLDGHPGDAFEDREQELLALIHDLNQCNDVLLSRVTQLESALAQARSAQQASQDAPQHIANLVGELDTAEQALNRQRLLNENLQTEVNNYQERIAQLERECTVVTQQHLEEVQARAKAESTSKDLRSRLQRQQRYTMQFKAALEKSLTVTDKPASMTVAQPVSFRDSASVAMPKAQRIMPWVSDKSSPFAGIDPHLESLIRGVGKSSACTEQKVAGESIRRSNKAVDQTAEQTATPEAEAKLWQDLERVIETAEGSVGSTEGLQEIRDLESSRIDDPIEPSAEPVVIPAESVSSSKRAEPAAKANLKVDSEKVDQIRQIETSFSAASHQVSEEPIAFTEPSPWKSSLPEHKKTDAESSSHTRNNADSEYLPAIDSRIDATVAPLAQPLRSPKKSASLSSIELPTFENAKVASFRR